jgi:hemerythrin-like domain-containing protein
MPRPERDLGRVARRSFLGSVFVTAGAVVTGCGGAVNSTGKTHGTVRRDERGQPSNEEAEVTPGEDLMQEHGVLERVLLVYGEAARRIDAGEPLDLAVVTSAAGIVRRFVEDYHEHNEETFVFPRLEAAGRESALVAILRRQHRRGREVTDAIVREARAGASPRLVELVRSFERMYRPHAAREDTVLFPAFRELLGRDAYRELGERFEEEEHARFGEHGFADTVAEVARLELALGIHDLARFTPPAI